MCRFTFDQNVEALWELHENRKYWTTDYVSLKVMTSLNDPTLIDINLMDIVAKQKAAKRKTTDDDFFWLPFTENTAPYREKTLVPHFTRACVKAGFNLISITDTILFTSSATVVDMPSRVVSLRKKPQLVVSLGLAD